MNEVHYSNKSSEWETPKWLFDKLNKEYNFTLDACATDENTKCSHWYTKEQNGLQKSWENEIVFVNPPYGNQLKDWVKKAYMESTHNNATVIMLIPARTDTSYFHTFIYGIADIEFLKGRVKFLQDGKVSQNAPFPSMVVVFRPASTRVLNRAKDYITNFIKKLKK